MYAAEKDNITELFCHQGANLKGHRYLNSPKLGLVTW